MGLKYYLRYATDPEQGLKDDSPLYIFDATFGKRKLHHSARRGKVDVEEDKKHRYDVEKSQATTHLVDDYSVPEYFRDDLFQLAGGRRPPFRWIVIGPPRSGTGIHVDPLGTSAWNALISGVKRWVLFPPETSKSIVKPKLKNSEASTWFAQVYPRLKEKDANGESLGDRLGMVEVVQVAGETMFVPGGWLHIVMNVEFSIAITQNFASVTNLEYVWLKTRFSRPKLADKLLRMIKDKSLSPALYKFSKGKRMRKAVKRIAKLETVPALETSTSDSSDSSSTTDSSSDSDANVVCECHGKRRRDS